MAVTLAGVPIGLVLGYLPALLAYGVIAVATQGTSQTGGWAEANAAGGVVWFGSAGVTIGFLQQRALPPDARSVWWIIAVGAVWAAAHVISTVTRVSPGDADLLASTLPALVVVSVGVGAASLRFASRAPRS